MLDDEGAAGIDAREHAPTDVDGAEDVALETDGGVGVGVDPEAAAEAGEGFRGGGWGRPVGVGGEVEHELSARDVRKLRLAWGVGVKHSVGQELNEVPRGFLLGALAVDVFEEVIGGGNEGVEAVALGGVFLGGEGVAVSFDEAGDGAVVGFDLVAELVAFVVDEMHTVAEVRAGVIERAEFGGGGFGGPELCGALLEGVGRCRWNAGDRRGGGEGGGGEENERGRAGARAMGEARLEGAMRVVRHSI